MFASDVFLQKGQKVSVWNDFQTVFTVPSGSITIKRIPKEEDREIQAGIRIQTKITTYPTESTSRSENKIRQKNHSGYDHKFNKGLDNEMAMSNKLLMKI